MAFKVSLTGLKKGLGVQSAFNIAILRHFATITPPITEAAMRANLETGQFNAFDNDDWASLMQQLASVTVEDSVLTTLERGIMNTLYEAANPSPSGACCGAVVPSAVNVSMTMSPLVGSATWQHSIDVKLNDDVDCNVHSIEIVLAGGPPATIPVAPIPTAYFKDCQSNGRHFSYLWTSYGGNPTGVTYTPTLSLYDADGILIVPAFALGGITL